VDILSGSVKERGQLRGVGQRVRACQCVVDSACLVVDTGQSADLIAHVEEAFTVLRPWPESGETLFAKARGNCALAVDIGTTTVAVKLFGTHTGISLAGAGALNAQTQVADDVLSRIEACAQAGGLERLQSLVLQTIHQLAQTCLDKAQRDWGDLGAMIVAGNTTMGHLFWGEDPTPMGKAPFTPRFTHTRRGDGAALLPEWAGIEVLSLPHMSAFIGADISAGLWAADFFEAQGVCVLMDIGTNGEIVLKTPQGIFSASAAAGPAFEGYGLSSGMRAKEGALESVRIKGGHLQTRTIANAPMIGICGSGYVDFLAEGARAGWLSEHGRFTENAPVLVHETHGRCVVLGGDEKAPVVVSEADIANLLKAKSAIAATLLTLLDKATLSPSDLDSVFVAGGFGKHIDAENAISCGLLPDVPVARIFYLGNASLGGACAVALDKAALPALERDIATVQTIAVNLEPSFEDHFIDEMGLNKMGENQ